MKFVPRHSNIAGRIVIKRILSSIVRPDETKDTTKFVLVDAVGPDAAKEGIKVGDVLVPNGVGVIKLDGGACVRPMLEEKNAAFFVRDITLDDLAVQTDNGLQYVPFNSPDAAKPLGQNPPPPEAEIEGAAA